MGLLSRMEALHAAEKQRLNGLSVCSAFSSAKKQIFDFHFFANTCRLPTCALLVPFGRRFFMRYSHGMDAETICKSISSVDFWNGTVPETNEWKLFSKSELEPFYQLFSSDFSQELKTIYVKSFMIIADCPIKAFLLIINSDFDKIKVDSAIPNLAEYVASDMTNIAEYYIDEQNPEPQRIEGGKAFFVDFSKAIEKIAERIDYEAQSILLPVVTAEIYNRISKIVPNGDFCSYVPENHMRIVFYNAKNLDADLLQFQLQKLLAPILNDTAAEVTVGLET